MPRTHEITALLQAWSDGDLEALDRLIPLVDHELKKIASAYMARERAGHILQTTELMDEALIKLMQEKKVSWRHRKQFYSIVAERMREVLVDYARRQRAAKRGNDPEQVELNDGLLSLREKSEEIILVNEALKELTHFDPRKASIVKLHFFAGLTFEEISRVLEISKSTVEREWTLARKWLKRKFDGESTDGTES